MSIVRGIAGLLGGKADPVHLGDHDEIAREGGTFALCGEWMTEKLGEGTPVDCRPCLKEDQRRENERGYDPNELYNYGPLERDYDDDPGTGMTW